MLRSLAAVGLAMAVTACAPARDYVAPKFAFFSKYSVAKPGAPALLNHTNWWREMHDPALDQLVALALSDSLDLTLARERVIAARAERRAVPGAATVTSSASLRGEGVGSDGPDLAGRGDLGLTWLFDPWGARRAQLSAADARIDIAEAELDAARLLVLYNLSNAYIELRYTQRRIVLARQELSRGTQALQLVTTRIEAQAATRQEVTLARARVASIRTQMPDLLASEAGKINEIAVLAGYAPGTLPAPLAKSLRGFGQQPRARMPADIGIPADLLRNRPDLRVAERRYYVALAEVDVARAALYPTLSLSGLISLSSVGSSRPEYYLGPSLRFPSLPLNSARASVELRHSLVRQAHESWKSDVLSAILQVENALLSYTAQTRSLGSAADATRLYREAAAQTRELLEGNDATISDLLEAQDEIAVAARREAELRFRQAQSFVEVNVRLGAGHKAGAGVAPDQGSSVRRDEATLTTTD